jgi:hypothetical protein
MLLWLGTIDKIYAERTKEKAVANVSEIAEICKNRSISIEKA